MLRCHDEVHRSHLHEEISPRKHWSFLCQLIVQILLSLGANGIVLLMRRWKRGMAKLNDSQWA